MRVWIAKGAVWLFTCMTLGSATGVVYGAPPWPQHTANDGLYDDTVLDRQYRALSEMPAVDVIYTRLGTVREITGDTGVSLSEPDRLREGDSAREILEKFQDVLLASGSESLIIRENEKHPIEGRNISVYECIRGIPVIPGAISISVDDTTGRVTYFNAYFVPDRGLPTTPSISASEASVIAVKWVRTSEEAAHTMVELADNPTLIYYGGLKTAVKPTLVWAFEFSYMSQAFPEVSTGGLFVDAIDGSSRDPVSQNSACSAPSEQPAP